MPVEQGVALCDDGPRVGVFGGFAGEVTGVKLGERGIEVVGVQQHACHNPAVGVRFDDVEHLAVELPGPQIAVRSADSVEDE